MKRGPKNFLPAEPLREIVRRRGGAKVVAIELSASLDAKLDSIERRLQRYMCERDRVPLGTADEICTALGLHIGEVFGWDVYGKGSAA